MRLAASLLFLLCGAAIAAPAAELPAPAPNTAAADPVFAHPAAAKELDALLGNAHREIVDRHIGLRRQPGIGEVCSTCLGGR